MSPEIHIIHSHAHTLTQLAAIITRPSHILFNDLVHSCVMCKENSAFFPTVLRSTQLSCLHNKKNKHTFLSEDDLVVSLLAVIRSGYPVFFKTTAKVFYI